MNPALLLSLRVDQPDDQGRVEEDARADEQRGRQ
jgi:hypothetical protein